MLTLDLYSFSTPTRPCVSLRLRLGLRRTPFHELGVIGSVVAIIFLTSVSGLGFMSCIFNSFFAGGVTLGSSACANFDNPSANRFSTRLIHVRLIVISSAFTNSFIASTIANVSFCPFPFVFPEYISHTAILSMYASIVDPLRKRLHR